MKNLIKVSLLLLLLLFVVGCSGVSTDDHQQVLDQLTEAEESLSFLEDEHQVVLSQLAETEESLTTLQNEYDSYRESTADWLEYSEEEKQAEIEIAKRETEIEELEKIKSDYESQVESLESQIEKLKDDVITIAGSPKTYPAGYLTAGKDFEVGRYKIYGGSSNFIVYSSEGRLRVNIILGSGSFAVNDYVYTFSHGDEVQANSSFTMVPIE